MCGICGEIRFDSHSPRQEKIEKMLYRLIPRGPDSGGAFVRGNVGLGHRRLKIIDTSNLSSQPMVDSHLGLSIVFNGAIYNYQELKSELEAEGYNFFSHGDTEVILKAFKHWGRDCVQRFNGMFAFAIFDHATHEVTLARDRLGIKPLYYNSDKDRFLFASTLTALLETGDVSKELDPVGVNYYMTFHSVVPPPHTILKDVKKIPPATVVSIKPNGYISSHVYWDISFGTADDSTRDEAELKDSVLQSLRAAVKRRLVADVPVGVLLSGGVDSSLLVGLLAEAGQSGITTFSIGFESVGEEKGDEFVYSDCIAEHFSTNHQKIRVSTERVLPALQHCVQSMAEPMVSHDAIGFYLLSEEVSKHVKVVQSGQGADEVFGGYSWYPPLVDSNEGAPAYAKVFFDRDQNELEQALSPDYHLKNVGLNFVEKHFGKPGAEKLVDKALRIDTQVMLVDDPVKRVDNMTMAWGLEARVPFLDHEVVECAATIPAEFKVRAGGKYILKEAAREIIPAKVIDRPKGYFPVPALKYIRGKYLDFVSDIVSSKAAKERNIFEEKYVSTLLNDPESHITPLKGSKLWQVALLEYWLQEHNL